MAKEKKKKTPTQKKKTLKAWSRTCFAGEFLSVVAPFVAIGIVNYDKYFIQYDGTKISIGFALAMCVMGVATWLVSKKKFTNSFITLIIGWAMITGILFLIKELLQDLCYIMLFGLIGILGAYGLDLTKEKLDKDADDIQKGIDIAEQEMTRDAYKEEIKEKEEKKVKVKVKKK